MYIVKLEPEAIKDLSKLDKFIAKRITAYLLKNVHKQDDPRLFGKALINRNPQNWRYRIGKIRVLCEIDDQAKIVYVVAVAYRKESYE